MENARKFYIDGELQNAVLGHVFPIINPSTEERFPSITLGDALDVKKAVGAANAAFLSRAANPLPDLEAYALTSGSACVGTRIPHDCLHDISVYSKI